MLGCTWIELPPSSWQYHAQTMTRCQIEVDVAWDAFIAHAPEGEWSKVAPFRILSFDIECAGRKGKIFRLFPEISIARFFFFVSFGSLGIISSSGIFPEPNHDPVIQIANMVIKQGEPEPFVRNIFTLDTCAPIVGCQVMSFVTEQLMLQVKMKILSGNSIKNEFYVK